MSMKIEEALNIVNDALEEFKRVLEYKHVREVRVEKRVYEGVGLVHEVYPKFLPIKTWDKVMKFKTIQKLVKEKISEILGKPYIRDTKDYLNCWEIKFGNGVEIHWTSRFS